MISPRGSEPDATMAAYPSSLRGGIANPLCVGANPTAASFRFRISEVGFRIFSVIAIGVLLSGCQTNPVTGKSEYSLLTPHDEIALGRRIAPIVEKEFGGLVYDPNVVALVEDVGYRLANVQHRHDLTYTFRVLNTEVPNAFSLPGGFVYITRGLLSKLKTTGEVAGVLGHEIGHITHRHIAQAYTRGVTLSWIANIGLIIASERSRDDNLLGLVLVTDLTLGVIQLGFSRNQEYEADTEGAKYSFDAGCKPDEMIRVMQVLKEIEQKEKYNAPTIFRTHPDPDGRIENLKRVIAALPKEPLYSFNAAPHPTERLTPFEKYDLARKQLKEGDSAGALSSINSAIELKRAASGEPLAVAEEPAFYVLRGRVFKSIGLASEAEKDYKKALSLDENYYEANYEMGNLLKEIGRPEQAKAYYAKCNDVDPGDKNALRGLALTAKQSNDSDTYRYAARSLERMRGR